MALTNFGFIVTGSELDPAANVSVMETSSSRMTTIGVATADQGPAAAQRLVADGVELIEPCGGFGPVWTMDQRRSIGSTRFSRDGQRWVSLQ